MQTVSGILEQYKKSPKEFPLQQEEAIKHFNRLGFPTTKNEEWKYTNISPILNKDFSFPVADLKISQEEILKRFPFLKDSIYVVTENGRLNTEISNLKNLPVGIEIKNLRDVKNLPLVKKHFNLYVDVQEDAFGALNTAFANDGIVILVSQNAVIEQPIYLVNISSSIQEAINVYDRLLIIAEKNSKAKIFSINISQNNTSETFVNSQAEVFSDENSSLEFCVLQSEN